MNLLERFIIWVAARRPSEPASPLTMLLGQARHAQYSEQYDESIRLLDEAEKLAADKHDVTAQVDIALSKADNLIYMERYDDAEALINDLRQRTEAASHRAPLSYALCSLGALTQARGNDAEARNLYERALQVARGVRATGAEARASAHLADTYLDEGNASYTLHLLKEALPRMETSGDTELEPYFLIRMAEAYIIVGNATEGDGLLEKALEKATDTGHQRYIRQAHLRLGKRAAEAGNYVDARKHYNEALPLFPDRLKKSPEYADALANSAGVLLLQGEVDTAAKQAEEALTLAQTLNQPDVLAEVESIYGTALSTMNKHAAALPHLQAAAQFYAQRPPDRNYLDIIRRLAATQAALGDTDSAMNLYRQAVDAAAAAGLRLASAEAAADSGRLHERSRNLKEALTEYTEALKIYEQLNENGHLARTLCIIGALREQMGQGRRGIKDFEQALTRLSYVNDPATRGTVLAQVAQAYTDYGDMDTAESFYGQSIEYARQTGDKIAEAERRTAYGRFLALAGDARPAITALTEANTFAAAQNLSLLLALQADGLATAYRLQDNLAQAMTYHDEALKHLSTIDEPEWKAACEINQAHTLLAQNRAAIAAPLFEDALNIGRAKQYPQAIVRALCGLAKIDLLNGLSEPAAAKLAEAAPLAQASYSKRLLAEVRLLQSQATTLTGNSQAALDAWQEAEKLMKILRLPAARPEWLPHG